MYISIFAYVYIYIYYMHVHNNIFTKNNSRTPHVLPESRLLPPDFATRPGKLWEIWEKHGKTYGKMLEEWMKIW